MNKQFKLCFFFSLCFSLLFVFCACQKQADTKSIHNTNKAANKTESITVGGKSVQATNAIELDSKQEVHTQNDSTATVNKLSPTPELEQVNATPTWYVDKRCFLKGKTGKFDQTSVKDPSIIYYKNKYYLFYTGVTKEGGWQIGYASAKTINGLKSAKHTFLSSIKEGYFCAPQVFYYEPQKKWYMIYNDGTYGAAYSTTTDISNPKSWKGPKSLELDQPIGYDFWVICDDKNAYLFYTKDGQSRTIVRRTTSLKKFPTGWSKAIPVATDTFEGVCVYKSQSNGKYYMLPEDYNDNRYYELWEADSLDGLWKQISEKWASQRNLDFTADHWTDNVSHGDILKSGYNQKQEIKDINRVDFLIQGVITSEYTGKDYAQIPWELGIIRNYKQ